jgi:hypothetical protein
MTILACGTNLVKTLGNNKFLTRLQQMLNGWRHKDPPTSKKLPVESDVPKFLVNESGHCLATALNHTVTDLTTIVFYYLLRIGEYTVKGTRNKTKHTVQFKMEDVTFFKKDKRRHIMCLSCNAPLADILSADGAALKLDNQRMDTREYVYTNKQPATPSTVQSTRWDDDTNTSGKIRQ